MSFQLLVTYLIIFAAVSYSLYHLYKVIKPPKSTSACGGCASCDIKKELAKSKVNLERIRVGNMTSDKTSLLSRK